MAFSRTERPQFVKVLFPGNVTPLRTPGETQLVKPPNSLLSQLATLSLVALDSDPISKQDIGF